MTSQWLMCEEASLVGSSVLRKWFKVLRRSCGGDDRGVVHFGVLQGVSGMEDVGVEWWIVM